MNYLRLEICGETQELVLCHDFKIEALRPVIDPIVANLKQRGTLLPQDICKASLTPRYEGTPRYEAEYISVDRVEIERACREVAWESANSLYALVFDHTLDADQPVAYWSLTIHPMTHRILYRRDLPLTALDQYVSEVKTALSRSQRLPPEVATRYRFFARNDDEGQFLTLAELGRPSMADIEIELLEPESVEHRRADKAEYLARSKPVTVGRTTGDLALFVRRSALEEVNAHISQSPDRESGGVLIGQVFEDTTSGELFVEVTHTIPARRAEANAISLRFTTETWQEINIQKRKHFPDQMTVGWYHSHLIAKRLLDQNGQIGFTEVFFSKDDLFIHENFFKEPWHVALVISSHYQQQAFFQWRSEPSGVRKVAVCGTYCILEDVATSESTGSEQ